MHDERDLIWVRPHTSLSGNVTIWAFKQNRITNPVEKTPPFLLAVDILNLQKIISNYVTNVSKTLLSILIAMSSAIGIIVVGYKKGEVSVPLQVLLLD